MNLTLNVINDTSVLVLQYCLITLENDIKANIYSVYTFRVLLTGCSKRPCSHADQCSRYVQVLLFLKKSIINVLLTKGSGQLRAAVYGGGHIR